MRDVGWHAQKAKGADNRGKGRLLRYRGCGSADYRGKEGEVARDWSAVIFLIPSFGFEISFDESWSLLYQSVWQSSIYR